MISTTETSFGRTEGEDDPAALVLVGSESGSGGSAVASSGVEVVGRDDDGTGAAGANEWIASGAFTGSCEMPG